ncbi:MAG: 2-amino-4-hydroxy-6-hydroxymethyldihydropteridine diphosphokinase [Phycisphaerae bacterium]
MQHKAYIGIGSNLGDRQANIARAIELLKFSPDVDGLRVSELIETEPVGSAAQPKYLNTVAELCTSLEPSELFEKMSGIEKKLGRKRQEKWESRTIDLDLLLYGDEIIRTKNLTVPHSQMHLRSFVLSGLCELNSRLCHPIFEVTVAELFSRLNGLNFKLNENIPQLISIGGLIGVGKTTLAKKLCEKFKTELLAEPYDKNPFMPAVYAGQKELALHSQLFFLFNRTEQLNPKNLKAGNLAIADYVFQKDKVYADLLLDENQLSIYRKLYCSCEKMVAQPVLIIYMTDSADNCLERIRLRNRPYEQSIKSPFLKALDAEYEKMFNDWQLCPVIRIPKANFDCNNPVDLEKLVIQIQAYTAARIAE